MISLNRQHINTTISERYACIIYSFNFENTRSNTYQSDELRFAITIDPDAFIAGFTADIDGQLFVGCTKEKQEAKQEYTAATEKHENAILISQPNKRISNVFQISTNIDSQSKITLNVSIQQYLQKRFHYNQLNIQLLNDFSGTTIQKNYGDIEYKFIVKDKRGISNLEIPLYKAGNINQNNKYIYNINGKISSQQLSLTNELVLKYKVDGESNESSLLFDEKSNTFCHIISDVINDAKEQNMATETEGGSSDAMDVKKICLIPRRVCFVIDRSGSMSGSKWDCTVKATITALKKLRHGIDRFRIILCGSQLDYIPKHINDLQLVQEKTMNDSIKYLSKQYATGCELLNDGLLEGIKAIKMDILKLNNSSMEYNFYMNQIVFISDGQPTIGETNVDKIISNVKNANDISKIDKYSNKISIFSFGVGRDGNGSQWMSDLPHHFLKSLSVNNNGFYKRIKQKTADKELNEYIDIFSKPISCNINIKYPNQVELNNLTQTQFDSLYEGNDLIICGKLPTNKRIKHITAVISSIMCKQVKGKNNKVIFEPTTINKTIKISMENDNNVNNVERICAYLTLQQYATQKLKYDDMIEIDQYEQKEQDQISLGLAMKYLFVTPWTSMIVVKEKQKEENKDEKEAPKIHHVIEQHKAFHISTPSDYHQSYIRSAKTGNKQSFAPECQTFIHYVSDKTSSGLMSNDSSKNSLNIYLRSDNYFDDNNVMRDKRKAEQDAETQKRTQLEQDVMRGNYSSDKPLDNKGNKIVLPSTGIILDETLDKKLEYFFSLQDGKCFSCGDHLGSPQMSRQCYYTKRLFCALCMDGTVSSIIPSKLIHNLDTRKYPISSNSKKHLDSMYDVPAVPLSKIDLPSWCISSDGSNMSMLTEPNQNDKYYKLIKLCEYLEILSYIKQYYYNNKECFDIHSIIVKALGRRPYLLDAYCSDKDSFGCFLKIIDEYHSNKNDNNNNNMNDNIKSIHTHGGSKQNKYRLYGLISMRDMFELFNSDLLTAMQTIQERITNHLKECKYCNKRSCGANVQFISKFAELTQ